MDSTNEGPAVPELWVNVVDLGEAQGAARGVVQLTAAAQPKTTARVTEEMLDGVNETLKKVCHMVTGAFAAVNRPDELVVKFGIKIGAKGGTNVFLLTEASGEATLAIEAKWTNPRVPAGASE